MWCDMKITLSIKLRKNDKVPVGGFEVGDYPEDRILVQVKLAFDV